MCQLLETIQCRDGRLINLEFHQKRVDLSRSTMFGAEPSIDLSAALIIPAFCQKRLFRCRIVYGQEIEQVEFIPVLPRVFNSFQLVSDNDIDYSFKYLDRSHLNRLLEQKNGADEIIIIKNGNVTDTSISNLVFFDGTDWVTPSSYLLNGTKRQFLLQSGVIRERNISANDLTAYSHFMMINALLDFDESRMIPIASIRH